MKKTILFLALAAVAFSASAIAAMNIEKRYNGGVAVGALAIGGTEITASGTELNYTDVTTIGTAQGSKAVVLDSAMSIAGLKIVDMDNLRLGSCSFSASADISTAQLHACQVFYVTTTGGAVDLDFGEDEALAAADVGQKWRAVIVAGTNALTITAGTTVSTVTTSQVGAGAACEDVGDYFEIVPYTTTAARNSSFCAD